MLLSAATLLGVLFLVGLHSNPLTASKIQLSDNGYENILIAINPQVSENTQIITNIKRMLIEASQFLYNATKRRFYYREVKILIPDTWQLHDYQRPRHEVYDKASVVITKPNSNYGNDPYTLQYGECGKEGKYIHFSPDFLTDESLLSVYGPRGKVFVHEWAHLRWGVFDEYNYEAPFFVSIENKIKATRCSSEISGMYICKQTSCSDGECMIDPQTGNLAEGCMFLVNSTQKFQASIMYMQALSSVVGFCDTNTHDKEAPNEQNRMCSYRSTWDVIMDSPDYSSAIPMPENVYPPPPIFSVLQARQRVLCLVLDVSGSMGNRIHQLRQAAAIFLLQFVETGSHVAIVTYNDTAQIRSPLREIDSDDVRRNLTSHLPDSSSGEACVCKGILAALQLLSSPGGRADGAEIVLVASGNDGYLGGCFSDVSLSGSVIHTIAIGPSADSELENLAELTGGHAFFASGNIDSNSLVGALSEISPRNGNSAQQFVKLHFESRLTEAGGQAAGCVFIDETVGNDTLFVITWQASGSPHVHIQEPSGDNYTIENLELDMDSKLAYFSIPGASQVGNWTYNITNTINSSQIFGLLVTSRPATTTSPPLIITAETNTKIVTFPRPLVLLTEVKHGFSTVLGVNVTAVMEPEYGDPIIVTLADNGAGADLVKNDGVYSRYVFSFNHSGRYSLKIHIESKSPVSFVSLHNSRAMYVPGYIENDTIRMNPPRPIRTGDTQSPPETFSRVLFVTGFKVTNVSQDIVPDAFPPCRINDLEAKMENDYVVLSWTAPGDNYDQGTVSSYEIRMGTHPLDLRERFDTAILVNTSALTPQAAGSRERFSFIPHKKQPDNGTITYIAVRTTDSASLQSDISNLVRIARPIQFINLNYARSTTIGKSSTSTVIYIVVSLLSLCLVIGVSMYSYRQYTISKLNYRAIENNLQGSWTSIVEMQTFAELQVQALPLHGSPASSTCDVITSVGEAEV
ncbi:calcium-activated chloride channel regulator 1-like [Pelodytes ibericus]